VCVRVRGKSLGTNVAHFFIFVCANVCVRRALGTRLTLYTHFNSLMHDKEARAVWLEVGRSPNSSQAARLTY